MPFPLTLPLSNHYIRAMIHTSLTSEDILGPDGMLSRRIDGFEVRPSQLEMALLIQKAFHERLSVIVEAGTGTGKTFGYLVPVLLSGKKAVISTGTKNLQEQIFKKDIPLLKKATSLDIDAMVMKGRKNYLCLHKYHQHFLQQSLPDTAHAKTHKKIEVWLKTTPFGDRGELGWLADDDPLWDTLSASSEQCIGSDCMFLEDCFLGKLRSRAARARIIIVNHHLFFADMKVKKGGFGEIIPRFQVAVFDEAHTIEEIATTHFGESISTHQLTEFVNELEKEIRTLPAKERAEARKPLDDIKGASEHLKNFFNASENKGRIDPETLVGIRNGPVREIRRGLSAVLSSPNIQNPTAQWGLILERAKELDRQMEEIASKRDATWLNWYERRKRSLVLHASPLDVSGSMNRHLYEKVHSVVLTSATLSTNHTFAYIHSRLGLPEGTLEGLHTSHFDFETQTRLYLPGNLPVPNEPDFASEAASEIMRILMKTKGRALVLFTSYFNLHRVHEIIAGQLPYTVFKQGDAPRSTLLEKFKEDIHSVLLATGSFWQGVDVPGEALSCLIIDKLPFASPGDPMVAARVEAIRSGGGNPFMDYQVPSAIISLKQGLGRLIRKASDHGVLAILDKRILTSRYGGVFLKSLPHIPVIRDRAEIDRFFESQKGTAKGAAK
ncbi:MAG: ATP-dependent DNA helicase [Deltaproteobacteria bacterium]|nr:ATP-dependent DNA helicase [Deltaproteobacteria bacterium]